jgi:hypothetical protein
MGLLGTNLKPQVVVVHLGARGHFLMGARAPIWRTIDGMPPDLIENVPPLEEDK